MTLFDVSEKAVLITGGYGHLGAVMARGVADYGARVFVLGRSRERFAENLSDPNDRIIFIECDISRSDSIKQAFLTAFNTHGRLDVLINNGIYYRGNDPMHITDSDWNFSIDGALNSVYRCIREAGGFFERQKSGNIINVGSMYGMVSPDFSVYQEAPASMNPPHYGAAKAALIQLTKYFAHYLGPSNVRVNAISPGPFPNPTVQRNRRFVAELSTRTALGRIGDPTELIGAVIFLASEASSYITGHNLVVDGGWTVR